MLELRTLGGLELRRAEGGTPGPIPLQTKRLVLLAHLAAFPAKGFRRRDSLLALFWPDLDQEAARQALNQALSFLRRHLPVGVLVTRGTVTRTAPEGSGPSATGVGGSRASWSPSIARS